MNFIDNEHTLEYYSIIDSALAAERECYTETHHIIPKSFYISVADDGWLEGDAHRADNLVALTLSEHAHCHMLLRNMTEGLARKKMVAAAWLMLHREDAEGDSYQMAPTEYAILREQLLKEMSAHQLAKIEAGDHNFIGERNPNFDGRNAKAAMLSGKHINLTNNTSTWRAEEGTHHWQDGKSPNFDGVLNAKLIADGTHNFLGPEVNAKRIAEQTHNLLGPNSNLARLVAGKHPSQMKRTCEHCGKICSVSMNTRWHGDNCKMKQA